MSWGAMVAAETDTLRTDHGLAQAQAETLAFDRNRHAESFKQGHRAGWWAAVTYILTRQAEWDELTESEAIRELRKGHGSIYFPLFKDDPRVWADCPRDGRVVVTESGICDGCLYDFTKD
ncbi:hypothetical protein J2Y46_002570 [Microbacterium sp. BE35]|uniref:hypothetical protein n=1 Tax=Microbacterium sp. BE35 TaxID=2817773 RepID=UPI0028555A10|nr:hypothetical protein [Microbacterium sp. BE35]MDR7189744.1 hypothetical protein [Microbacterium sp. BE35]